MLHFSRNRFSYEKGSACKEAKTKGKQIINLNNNENQSVNILGTMTSYNDGLFTLNIPIYFQCLCQYQIRLDYIVICRSVHIDQCSCQCQI